MTENERVPKRGMDGLAVAVIRRVAQSKTDRVLRKLTPKVAEKWQR